MVMQVGELKGEWGLEAEEEQASIDVCDISEAEITVGQIQGSLISTQVEIFDSGTCCHISPYRDAFSNISDIPPRSLRAANKQSFSAVGKGDMVIDVPNGSSISQLKLTEVLYSPEAGYTLVSIGYLDEAGFTTTFANGKCVIRDPCCRYTL